MTPEFACPPDAWARIAMLEKSRSLPSEQNPAAAEPRPKHGEISPEAEPLPRRESKDPS